MTTAQRLSTIASCTFGTFCIASALPFIGVPIPNKASVDYYTRKSEWMAQLSGDRLTPVQAGYCGALLRVVVGACCIYPGTREAALLLNGAVVVRGTFSAHRDGKPMLPQWGMLAAMGACLILGRL